MPDPSTHPRPARLAWLTLVCLACAAGTNGEELKPTETPSEPLEPIKPLPGRGWDVPREESELTRIDPGRIRALLPGHPVTHLGSSGAAALRNGEGDTSRAQLGFHLSVASLVCLGLAVCLAWSIGRPGAEGGG